MTLFVSTNFSDIISIRIAVGSAAAFFIAQNIDVEVFDKLRDFKFWFAAPLVSSFLGSVIDTFIFFSISFYGTSLPWITLALGDLTVKLFVAFTLLIPFKIVINHIKDFSTKNYNKSKTI